MLFIKDCQNTVQINRVIVLDKSKLFKEIEKISDTVLYDFGNELEIAKQIWQRISTNVNFPEEISNLKFQWVLPTWYGSLSDVHKIENKISEYTIIAVDGSQVYPDRHQGSSCFLINIGSVVLNYGKNPSVKFNSVPYVFSNQSNEESSAEIVDCKREELEFFTGLQIAQELKKEKNKQLLLFDGSLIFWHLESKSNFAKDTYLGKYLGILHQFYKEDLLIAGYISLPKSKELVNLLRVKLSDFEPQNFGKIKTIDNIVDSQVVAFFLDNFQHTTIFQNKSRIVEDYPLHLQPHFVYLDVGSEIARIEIPAWIAQDKSRVDLVLAIIIDQCIKGYGYPVCLAEAHEQAVVKASDREVFYQLINNLAVKNKQQIITSQKSMKKRRMGI